MALHAFVAMPFGVKEGIDFNRIYAELIGPALEDAGFETFRADQEMRAGEIRKDMFQELLLADLVVVDLSVDNPNVWYELGVRHALRSRGVVQILCRRDRLPFDVVTDRVLRYHETNGVPDPLMRDTDKANLTRFVTETMQSWHGWKVSPVYQLVPYLKEPDWKSLQVADTTEFWSTYDDWRDRVEISRRRTRPGDILVLTEETPTWMLRLEARRMAGQALLKLGQYSLAMEQFESALAIEPSDFESHRSIGVILGRLDRHEEAQVWIRDIIDDNPHDAESWSLLGRLEKTEWVKRWSAPGADSTRMQALAAVEEELLREAITAYQTAFKSDPRHHYSGINALTLRHLLTHLNSSDDDPVNLASLEGGVRWACLAALDKDSHDYWARASSAELELLTADNAAKVTRAFRHAVAAAERDWFALDSARQQLQILRGLGFRPDMVKAAMEVLELELSRLTPPKVPRQVLLFSGHMIDKPDRKEPRFPPSKETLAADAISATLQRLEAGSDDIGLCSGACGGDLLFAEACLTRNIPVILHLPVNVPAFIEASVAFADDNWTERFYAVKKNPLTTTRVIDDELGPAPKGVDPYSRNNLWLLYTALAYGPDKSRFITLWNGREGDGPGGTKDMVEKVKKHCGQVLVLDTNTLW
jgi:tetratricopeptide (TPR) repeat protein